MNLLLFDKRRDERMERMRVVGKHPIHEKWQKKNERERIEQKNRQNFYARQHYFICVHCTVYVSVLRDDAIVGIFRKLFPAHFLRSDRVRFVFILVHRYALSLLQINHSDVASFVLNLFVVSFLLFCVEISFICSIHVLFLIVENICYFEWIFISFVKWALFRGTEINFRWFFLLDFLVNFFSPFISVLNATKFITIHNTQWYFMS